MSNLPLYGPPSVGADILAYCTRCKIELAHVVVSMVDKKPARVICKTCKSTHNFKRIGLPISKTRSILGTAKKAPPKTFMRASEHWEQKMAEHRATAARPYSVKERYTSGQVIQHPQFGMGLVEEVKLSGKIVVLFRDGDKVLVHGIGAGAAS
jgi:hypothetical protein